MALSPWGRCGCGCAGGLTYGYSAENALQSVSGVGTLAYDALDRLADEGAGTATRFNYDGQMVIAEHNSSNVLTRRYVHGPGADEPLVWYEGSGTGLGAAGGSAAGAAFGPSLGIPPIAAGVAGIVLGSVTGEKLGELEAETYAQLRGSRGYGGG